jgi:hypothetical protein
MQTRIDGILYLSRREMRRIGLTAAQARAVEAGGADLVLPNPLGYAGRMPLYRADRVERYAPHEIVLCEDCGTFHENLELLDLPLDLPGDVDEIAFARIERENRRERARIVGCYPPIEWVPVVLST